VVQNDWTLRFENRWFPLAERHQKLALAGRSVMVCQRLDGRLELLSGGRELSYRELPASPERKPEEAAPAIRSNQGQRPAPPDCFRRSPRGHFYLCTTLDELQARRTAKLIYPNREGWESVATLIGMERPKLGTRVHGGLGMVGSVLAELGAVFSLVTDPRKARGVRHPIQGIVALVFLGLLARITEMAVLVRWAAANWEELQEPLGFTRKQPPCDTTISRALAKVSMAEFRQAFAIWLKSALANRQGRWVAAVDGKTCCQGFAANGSPVHMLNIFLQQTKSASSQGTTGNLSGPHTFHGRCDFRPTSFAGTTQGTRLRLFVSSQSESA